MRSVWPRPVPTVGDTTTAAERAADPAGWAFPEPDRQALARILEARRDIRRFRPDDVDERILRRVLQAAHTAPSVGHSQPWRFVIVRDPGTRARAATMADTARLAQAQLLDPDSGRHLLDLDLEGIREAPVGVVVCCDRRAPAAGVLGRATFADADLWSCACAIQNLWLAARAEGLGVGWVTLFEPDELAALVSAPEGVTTLGWLCVGWPDERPPDPGLERRGWSARQSLDEVMVKERWASEAPAPPLSRARSTAPDQKAVVAAHDTCDALLTPPGSLGVLDRVLDRLLAVNPAGLSPDRGILVMAAADHPVAARGVSAFQQEVTRSVAEAALAGASVGAVAAESAGLNLIVVDAGVEGPALDRAVLIRPIGPKGDLVERDALEIGDCRRLVEAGAEFASSARADVVALGEVGVGNTTVAAALAASVLELQPASLVGLGAGADTAMLMSKKEVVEAAVNRVGHGGDPLSLLASLGGGEIAVLTGVVLGAASSGSAVVLDGLATSVAALVAARLEPAVCSHLIAGQRSREPGHAAVLAELGLEPLLDLRLRAGEGVGAALAVGLLRAALAVRRNSARTTPDPTRAQGFEDPGRHPGVAARR
jgi:nicotinate-nucleotide--dimethylbenzimidazole phosphoribosyltransferase